MRFGSARFGARPRHLTRRVIDRLAARGLVSVCALLVAAVLASCGSGSGNAGQTAGTGSTSSRAAKTEEHVSIYASLPLTGGESGIGQALLAGIKFALASHQYRVGDVRLRLAAMDDATTSGAWNPQQVVQNAQQAALDPTTVAYIGDLNSSASGLSMPLLNAAGVLQISPGSPYVGLTNAVAGVTGKNEPGRYSPSSVTSFVRLLGSNAVEADAMLTALSDAGCKQVAIANSADRDDVALAALLKNAAAVHGISTAFKDEFPTIYPAEIRGYVQQVRALNSRCVAVAVQPGRQLATLIGQLRVAIPGLTIVGDQSMCVGGWISVASGAAATIGRSALECVSNLLPVKSYPEGAAFATAWRAVHPAGALGAEQLIGYASAQVAIDAITAAESNGYSRDAVRRAVTVGNQLSTALGSISFDANGNSSFATYAVYRFAPTGQPKFQSLLVAES